MILQPGARYWFKAWPPERFAELADRLTAQYGCQVLIGGSDQDIDLAQQIRQMASRVDPVIMAGRATIKQFAAIAKQSALFVGSDSGAMHIASAVGTPVVALFGPSNPREWGPRGGPVEVLYKGIDCRACFHPTCQRGEQNCMKQLSSRRSAMPRSSYWRPVFHQPWIDLGRTVGWAVRGYQESVAEPLEKTNFLSESRRVSEGAEG